ncbi:MAG: helix-turn-helix domain-containing protein [Gammaproteobacteria bacterium]|nr:helix-turn-helix domain-containing protein [Gammaproteobacteria bacterium]
MSLNFQTCYDAIANRDTRFDGHFFTGVSSTGIFCRPICPATTPKPENCRFYLSAGAAMDAGFRPCLRCRPESAPYSPAWNGVKTTVSRALKMIDDGALDDQSVDQFAMKLGVGERYLRKLFSEHVGASPTAVARARRVLVAKGLITDSKKPMTEIAHLAGFRSIRQFNDTFKHLYGKPPSSLRKSSK